jgi:hypothetical protein
MKEEEDEVEERMSEEEAALKEDGKNGNKTWKSNEHSSSGNANGNLCGNCANSERSRLKPKQNLIKNIKII